MAHACWVERRPSTASGTLPQRGAPDRVNDVELHDVEQGIHAGFIAAWGQQLPLARHRASSGLRGEMNVDTSVLPLFSASPNEPRIRTPKERSWR